MAKLRCAPGDLAIITSPKNESLLGRIVLVQGFNADAGRWNILLMGAPIFGITSQTKQPVITNEIALRDSSLRPINGGGEVLKEMLTEVDHA